MDGFSYINIFETKGIEYIIIISFLLLVIPFWLILNRKKHSAAGSMNADTSLSIEKLRVPHGLFYSKNHTWTYLEKSGKARVGIDDLLLHITGSAAINKVKVNGDMISRGDVLAELNAGGKTLKILSPLTGKISAWNGSFNENPGLLNEDPYEKGWICKIKPSEWVSETSGYNMAEQAVEWTKHELERFKDFLAVAINKYSAQASPIMMQDGGEVLNNPFPEMPVEAWNDFQISFLNETC